MPTRNPVAHLENEAESEVRAVYRDLAGLQNSRACTLRTECCQFLLTGKTPHLTRGEALVAKRGLRAAGRTSVARREDGACPMLDSATSRCRIYDARPFGCRTHFCQAAGGPYARRDVVDLIRRLEVVDAKLGGEGAQALPTAMADVIRK